MHSGSGLARRREPDLLLSPDGIVFLSLGLNLCAGMVFGWLYWKRGLEAAFIAHMVASLAKIATELAV